MRLTNLIQKGKNIPAILAIAGTYALSGCTAEKPHNPYTNNRDKDNPIYDIIKKEQVDKDGQLIVFPQHPDVFKLDPKIEKEMRKSRELDEKKHFPRN